MDPVKKIICGSCKKHFPVSEMKYVMKDKKSVHLVCRECGEKSKNKQEQKKELYSKVTLSKTYSKNVSDVIAAEPKKKSVLVSRAIPTPSLQKNVYQCSRCDFSFRYNPSWKQGPSCPYCGKSDKIVECRSCSADGFLKNH